MYLAVCQYKNLYFVKFVKKNRRPTIAAAVLLMKAAMLRIDRVYGPSGDSDDRGESGARAAASLTFLRRLEPCPAGAGGRALTAAVKECKESSE